KCPSLPLRRFLPASRGRHRTCFFPLYETDPVPHAPSAGRGDPRIRRNTMAAATTSRFDLGERSFQKPAAAPTSKSSLTNVSDWERIASVAGGVTFAALGLARGSLSGLALGVMGGGLIYRGATGHCSVYQALGINTAQPRNPASSIPATEGVKVEKTI